MGRRNLHAAGRRGGPRLPPGDGGIADAPQVHLRGSGQAARRAEAVGCAARSRFGRCAPGADQRTGVPAPGEGAGGDGGRDGADPHDRYSRVAGGAPRERFRPLPAAPGEDRGLAAALRRPVRAVHAYLRPVAGGVRAGDEDGGGAGGFQHAAPEAGGAGARDHRLARRWRRTSSTSHSTRASKRLSAWR